MEVLVETDAVDEDLIVDVASKKVESISFLDNVLADAKGARDNELAVLKEGELFDSPILRLMFLVFLPFFRCEKIVMVLYIQVLAE